MVDYPKIAVKLATAITIALMNFAWISPAIAIERSFELNSDRGYRLETNFAYKRVEDSPISERGKGKTQAIDFLQVRFYAPDGKMIASYDNIVDGIARGEYFEINYDPKTQKLSGNLDLGGESAGEIYLKGNMSEGLSLIEVEPTGEEKVISSGSWSLKNGDRSN